MFILCSSLSSLSIPPCAWELPFGITYHLPELDPLQASLMKSVTLLIYLSWNVFTFLSFLKEKFCKV